MENREVIKIDPYNDEHIELVQGFERELNNNMPINVSDILLDIRKKSKKEYFNKVYYGNEIEDNYYLKVGNRLVSSCFVEGKKDFKSCTLELLTLPNERKKGYASYLLEDVSDKLFASNIEIIHLDTEPNNNELIDIANEAGFEMIGLGNNSSVHFMKENEIYESGKSL